MFRRLIGPNISVLGILFFRFWNRLMCTKQTVTMSILVLFHISFQKVMPYQAGFFGQYFVKNISEMFENDETLP